MQIKRMRSDMVISQEMLESWIKVGDNIWYTCMEEEEENDEKKLQDAFYSCISDAGLIVKNGTEIVPYDEEWDNDEVEPEDDLYHELLDHNWFLDIDDAGIPINETTTAEVTHADGARYPQCTTSSMKIAEVATDAEGTTSTTFLTSNSTVTEEATTSVAVATDAEGARSTLYARSHDNGTEELTDKEGTTNTKYMSYHTTATEEVPTTAPVGTPAKVAKVSQYVQSHESKTGKATNEERTTITTSVTLDASVLEEATTSTSIELAVDTNADSKDLVMTGQEIVTPINVFQESNTCALKEDSEFYDDKTEHSTLDENTINLGNVNTKITMDTIAHDDGSKTSMNSAIDDISDSNGMTTFVPTSQYDNKRYRHGYTVKLQKTCDGFMIGFTIGLNDKPLLEDYYLAFLKYIRHPDNKISRAEDLKVMHNEGDILVAIDRDDLSGKRISDVLQMLGTKKEGDIVEFTFVDREAFNAHDYKRVRTGNVQRENEY